MSAGGLGSVFVFHEADCRQARPVICKAPSVPVSMRGPHRGLWFCVFVGHRFLLAGCVGRCGCQFNQPARVASVGFLRWKVAFLVLCS